MIFYEKTLIKTGKVKWAWALNFKEEKIALSELKKVINYIDYNLNLGPKYFKIGIEGKRGVKLEAQDHFFFTDLRKFLKGWEQRRIDRVEGNKKNESLKKEFPLPTYPKSRYGKLYTEYLVNLNELLNKFNVLELPINPKTQKTQKTNHKRLKLMYELLELLEVEFILENKNMDTIQADKEARIKTILSRIYK